jgi:chromosome segregation ATPase
MVCTLVLFQFLKANKVAGTNANLWKRVKKTDLLAIYASLLADTRQAESAAPVLPPAKEPGPSKEEKGKSKGEPTERQGSESKPKLKKQRSKPNHLTLDEEHIDGHDESGAGFMGVTPRSQMELARLPFAQRPKPNLTLDAEHIDGHDESGAGFMGVTPRSQMELASFPFAEDPLVGADGQSGVDSKLDATAAQLKEVSAGTLYSEGKLCSDSLPNSSTYRPLPNSSAIAAAVVATDATVDEQGDGQVQMQGQEQEQKSVAAKPTEEEPPIATMTITSMPSPCGFVRRMVKPAKVTKGGEDGRVGGGGKDEEEDEEGGEGGDDADDEFEEETRVGQLETELEQADTEINHLFERVGELEQEAQKVLTMQATIRHKDEKIHALSAKLEGSKKGLERILKAANAKMKGPGGAADVKRANEAKEEAESKVGALEAELEKVTAKSDKTVDTWKKRAEKSREALKEKEAAWREERTGLLAAKEDSAAVPAAEDTDTSASHAVVADLKASHAREIEALATARDGCLERMAALEAQLEANEAKLVAAQAAADESAESAEIKEGTEDGAAAELELKVGALEAELEKVTAKSDKTVDTWKKRAEKSREALKEKDAAWREEAQQMKEKEAAWTEGVQQMKEQGDEEVRSVSAALDQANKEVAKAKAEAAAAAAAAAEAEAEAEAVHSKEVVDAKIKMAKAVDEATAAKAELAASKTKAAAAQADGKGAKEEMGMVKAELAAAKEELAAAKEEIGDAKREAVASEKGAAAAKRQAQKDVTAAQKEVQKAIIAAKKEARELYKADSGVELEAEVEEELDQREEEIEEREDALDEREDEMEQQEETLLAKEEELETKEGTLAKSDAAMKAKEAEFMKGMQGVQTKFKAMAAAQQRKEQELAEATARLTSLAVSSSAASSGASPSPPLFTQLTSLHGQRAIVTGASKGIGSSIATALASAGADVLCLGRDMKGLESTRAAVEAAGRKCWVVQADFGDEEQVKAAAAEVLAAAPSWNILVNNHGANTDTPLLQPLCGDSVTPIKLNFDTGTDYTGYVYDMHTMSC